MNMTFWDWCSIVWLFGGIFAALLGGLLFVGNMMNSSLHKADREKFLGCGIILCIFAIAAIVPWLFFQKWR